MPEVRLKAFYRPLNGFLHLLRSLAPSAAIPTFCCVCLTKMESGREEIFEWNEDYRVQGIRLWRCPSCGDSVEQSYSYLQYLDIH